MTDKIEMTDLPTRSKGIVERLEAKVDSGQRAVGGGSISSDGCVSNVWGGEPIMVLRNPDGPEAAARIRTLEAEIARLAADRVARGLTGVEELPAELLAELSCLPEEAPADFTCAICRAVASNRWHYSPRDYERPPICRSCETHTGFDWTGRAIHRSNPSGGTHRDKREAHRIAALADAIAQEAHQQVWRRTHGIA